jgi:hypothetical protein
MLEAPSRRRSSTLVANIPFQFNVGKAVLPSGEYRVKPANPSPFLIQSKDGRQSQMTIDVSSSKKRGQREAALRPNNPRRGKMLLSFGISLSGGREAANA